MQLVDTEKEYKNFNNLEIKQKNVITVTGANGVGKSVISLILSKLKENSNNLLIEFFTKLFPNSWKCLLFSF